MNIVNLTPHNIKLCGVNYPGAGKNAARMEVEEAVVDTIDNGKKGVPVYWMNFVKTINLPDPQEDTIYIVSKIVAENNTDRTDIYTTCKPIRDDRGKIYGNKGLSIIMPPI